MTVSLQDILVAIPFHQIRFLTPLPKEPIRFEIVTNKVPQQWLEQATLLIFKQMKEWGTLIEGEKLVQLLQDPNLAGLIICHAYPVFIKKEIHELCQQCGIPILQLFDSSYLSYITPNQGFHYSYSQFSNELPGFMEKGFIPVAAELAKSFKIPIILLDDQFQVLWQTGNEEELEKIQLCVEMNNGKSQPGPSDPYEFYTVYNGNNVKHQFVSLANLTPWQKKFMDKLAGLTTLQIQAMEIFHYQQVELRDHFVYDLLYHKFESKTIMVKQGKPGDGI